MWKYGLAGAVILTLAGFALADQFDKAFSEFDTSFEDPMWPFDAEEDEHDVWN